MKGTFVTRNVNQRCLLIYLPPGYPQDGYHYPVVYVQDTGDVFDPDQSDSIFHVEEMFAHGELSPLILVGIEPFNRLDEYTPWPAPALDNRFADFGGQGAAYLEFVVEVCKPFIDKHFQTDPRAEMTAIIGKSLGGLISLYALYLYPHVFRKIASISGSFWYPGVIEYMKEQPIDGRMHRLYLDVGSMEGWGKENIQKEMVARTKEAYALLEESGNFQRGLHFTVEEGAEHQLPFFAKRFPHALKWLYSVERK
ncbi:alpha/beta hydrolase [Brevibacillus migulae]|uniref:alpha/beta hydrolase n=1 Tax=Brevibacillus migulae TaxID=1644114 RepID=UPI00106E78FE|nr:alpha/beta hydrolase-fold protein [Brevibacillus migulae]